MAESDLSLTMRVWSHAKRGRPRDVLRLHENHTLPPMPKRDEVLIQVHNVGMNPSCSDIVMRLIGPMGSERVAEIEFSGTVIAVGTEAKSRFTKGQAVFGAIDDQKHLWFGEGVMQDYLLLNKDAIYPVPKELSMGEAAGLICAGQTALNMIQTAGVVTGSRVFINGASGGVGMFCVQICKAVGAHVVASCSEQSRQFVEGLNPDEIVDYQANHPLAKHLAREYRSRPFDTVLDTIGIQELYDCSPQYLVAKGIYANAGAYSGICTTLFCAFKNYCWPTWLGGTPRKWIMIRTIADRVKMERLLELVKGGRIKVPIDSIWDVNKGEEEIFKAYDRVLSQRAKGKVIVKLVKE